MTTLLTSLVSHWKFNSDAQDSHGLNHLTATNTPTYSPGKLGTAVNFVAASLQKLVKTDDDSIGTGDIDWTLSFWYKQPAPNGVNVVVSKDNQAGLRDWELWNDGTTWHFVVQGIADIAFVPNFANNQWYLLTLDHSATNNTAGIRINDRTRQFSSTSGPAVRTAADFQICGAGAGNFGTFSIDSMDFWKRSLTNDEARQMFNSGAGLDYPLIAVPAPSQAITCAMLPERWEYITPDSIVYNLSVPGARVVIQDDGTGMAPIEYLTQRGPFQHGESLKSFYLKPRVVELLLRHNHSNRNTYWQGRAGILDTLRPNRSAQPLDTGTLRRYLSTGEIRDLSCLVQEGPSFAPHDRGTWDEWSFTDVVRFVGFDPTWFNPLLHTVTFGALTGDLTFPITFPISFGSNAAIEDIQYQGTWPSYPTIVINGPISNPVITNVSTGKVLDINIILATGESLTIDLSYGTKTITKNDGTNLIGFITPESDLTEFRLDPAPIAPNGVNRISIASSGGGGSTSTVLTWYDRYIGI